jgi:3-hydroxyisobutyrate dehydrogenase-like beta-hydroxyacid dehydrogenase
MNVGFIGLGTMGRHMAANLAKGGFALTVHDVRRDAPAPPGATWADSPAALARAVDVVFTSLPGPVEVEAVAAGLLEGLRPGTAFFDLSTNSPTVVRRLHAAFAAKGISMLDAPVSGGPRGAESRKLALWVGGDENVFDKHRAVLDAIGDKPYYVGPIGAGSVAKLVHNCAGYVVQTALAEVFTMGVKAGVDPLTLWRAVRQGAGGRRRTFDGLADQFLPNEYEPPAFALRLAHKDVSLATQLGREVKVPMRLANSVLEELTEAMNRGWAEKDSRVAMVLQQERAGVEIKVPRGELKKVIDAG